MNASKGFIKIKIDNPKEVISEGGIIIPIEQGAGYGGARNYQAQKYSPTHGEVVSVGGDYGVKEGDIVMFHFTTEETCKQQGRIEYDVDVKYLFVEADRIVCYKRGDQLKPMNGWLLAERAEKAIEKTNGGIEIPIKYRKESDTKFRVLSISDNCHDICVGDIIYTERDCDLRLQISDVLDIVEDNIFKIKIENVVAKQI